MKTAAKVPSTRSKTKARIPRFKTIGEEAEFWDSHSLTEFSQETEEVEDVRFVRPAPKKGMTLRLEPDTQAILTRLARAKGIGPSTLARMWILERLRDEDAG